MNPFALLILSIFAVFALIAGVCLGGVVIAFLGFLLVELVAGIADGVARALFWLS